MTYGVQQVKYLQLIIREAKKYVEQLGRDGGNQGVRGYQENYINQGIQSNHPILGINNPNYHTNKINYPIKVNSNNRNSPVAHINLLTSNSSNSSSYPMNHTAPSYPNYSIDRCILWGRSMGTLVLLLYTQSYPFEVQSIILDTPIRNIGNSVRKIVRGFISYGREGDMEIDGGVGENERAIKSHMKTNSNNTDYNSNNLRARKTEQYRHSNTTIHYPEYSPIASQPSYIPSTLIQDCLLSTLRSSTQSYLSYDIFNIDYLQVFKNIRANMNVLLVMSNRDHISTIGDGLEYLRCRGGGHCQGSRGIRLWKNLCYQGDQSYRKNKSHISNVNLNNVHNYYMLTSKLHGEDRDINIMQSVIEWIEYVR